jgi:hypothetical protein
VIPAGTVTDEMSMNFDLYPKVAQEMEAIVESRFLKNPKFIRG